MFGRIIINGKKIGGLKVDKYISDATNNIILSGFTSPIELYNILDMYAGDYMGIKCKLINNLLYIYNNKIIDESTNAIVNGENVSSVGTIIDKSSIILKTYVLILADIESDRILDEEYEDEIEDDIEDLNNDYDIPDIPNEDLSTVPGKYANPSMLSYMDFDNTKSNTNEEDDDYIE